MLISESADVLTDGSRSPLQKNSVELLWIRGSRPRFILADIVRRSSSYIESGEKWIGDPVIEWRKRWSTTMWYHYKRRLIPSTAHSGHIPPSKRRGTLENRIYGLFMQTEYRFWHLAPIFSGGGWRWGHKMVLISEEFSLVRIEKLHPFLPCCPLNYIRPVDHPAIRLRYHSSHPAYVLLRFSFLAVDLIWSGTYLTSAVLPLNLLFMQRRCLRFTSLFLLRQLRSLFIPI